MWKLKLLLIPGIATVMAAIAIATAGGNSADTTYADASIDAEEQAFITLLNQYRESNDLPPLLIDPGIGQAADWMSSDMGVNNYFSHTDSLGQSPWTRMCNYGYCYNTWKGENIAAGYTTGASVFQGWKDSPGHNANMLNVNYRVMGVARVYTSGSDYGWYWTNDFGGYVAPGTSPTATPPPAPTATPSPTPTPLPTASPTPTTPPRPTATPVPTPTASATPAPTDTPTATPTPEPTKTPAPTPTPVEAAVDVNCDSRLTGLDSVQILIFSAGMPPQLPDGCPPIDSASVSAGGVRTRGDLDCNGRVDAQDALIVLRFVSGERDSVDC